MSNSRPKSFPEFLYCDAYGGLSHTKGTLKEFRYVLKKITENNEYVSDLATLYKMTGIDFGNDFTAYMDNYDEVLVSDTGSYNRLRIKDNIDPCEYNRLAAYKIVGRHVQNPNRVYINQKTKDTIKKREQMAIDVPMILKVTSGKVIINRVLLLDYINKELKKKGYDPLPKDRTYVEVD